ncbi:phage tail tape measure protein [Bosea sp. Leaf344]|uniref:phage tail tape measure protein n=1 Tax=Bosea sp. Leaf344 TaxID=1736346 RepID=UPI000AF04880|nr:phage tail tape measure protein [Bosea sp. Leaf344]
MADDNARLAELRTLDTLTKSLSAASDSLGRSLTSAFSKGIVEGRRFEDVLRGIGRSMSETLLRTAVQPLSSGLASLFAAGAKNLGGALAGQLGGAGAPRVTPFAAGGVIASPAYFPVGRGLGVMGEAGAEAILPLARGADGRLGVRSEGQAARPLSVTVQVSTPDAESFRRSEAQVAAAIARAVARGSRAL